MTISTLNPTEDQLQETEHSEADIVEGYREQARKLAHMAELQERLQRALRELDALLRGAPQEGAR